MEKIQRYVRDHVFTCVRMTGMIENSKAFEYRSNRHAKFFDFLDRSLPAIDDLVITWESSGENDGTNVNFINLRITKDE